jgi:hypothetical protein
VLVPSQNAFTSLPCHFINVEKRFDAFALDTLSDIKKMKIYTDIVSKEHQAASIEHFNIWHQ